MRFVAPAKLITHRPDVVSTRVRVGDWEGDLIMGRGNRSAIGTLVDRRSGYVVLVHLPAGHASQAVRDALTDALVAIPQQLRRTLTWDQGSEMACHNEIAHLLSDGVYFAEPGRPWQRGSNENTNGLLRQYFPKGTDLGVHDAEHLASVAHRLEHASAQATRMANTGRRLRRAPTLLTTRCCDDRPNSPPSPKGQHSTVVDSPATLRGSHRECPGDACTTRRRRSLGTRFAARVPVEGGRDVSRMYQTVAF